LSLPVENCSFHESFDSCLQVWFQLYNQLYRLQQLHRASAAPQRVVRRPEGAQGRVGLLNEGFHHFGSWRRANAHKVQVHDTIEFSASFIRGPLGVLPLAER
jgi:hypothetical protein